MLKKKLRVFSESPYDIETIFETLSVASESEKELLFMDKFISKLRKNPNADITELNYEILTELSLIQTPKFMEKSNG